MSEYEIYAIRYAHHADRPIRSNFLGGDPRDGLMPMDYFIWLIRGEAGTFVLDTGFDAGMAAKRDRALTRPIEAGLALLGVDAAEVKDVIISHMHHDHAGNHDAFPRARYHLQDREMHFCTGRCMCHAAMTQAFEVDDVVAMVRKVFAGRVRFHDGDREIAPGLSVHWVGGHSGGLQVVRVRTRRGWVVLASDATHYYANMEEGRPFSIASDVGAMLEAFATMEGLATSHAHIVPGHDPLVLQRYPAVLEGVADIVRLDADPLNG
ncbi:N-acyl homoserine lactonase family protein [Marinivivus vitaminiproducens]|uniref:N-acyl homoserine lactonase family protein n=1 Tax=Marinivivus vitaminiproducens TaxID=3035935 RepID=UPI0027A96FE8|nr:N-acyl homoserine lactonase family protein [Geminicoccaceae bacterium SCSIO 64248]